MWILHVPPGVCFLSIYPSFSTFPVTNTTASKTDHYHSNLSRLESQQVELASAGHATVTMHRWCPPTRPPVTHYADIWRRRRGGARTLMQSGCENIRRETSLPHSPHPTANHPLPASSNHSLCPFNYHHVASATSGESLPASKSFSRKGATLSLSSGALRQNSLPTCFSITEMNTSPRRYSHQGGDRRQLIRSICIAAFS